MGTGSGLLRLLGLAAALSFFAAWATYWWWFIKSWREGTRGGLTYPWGAGHRIWVGGSVLGGFALAAVALVPLQVGGHG
jgi:hypothetical protein